MNRVALGIALTGHLMLLATFYSDPPSAGDMAPTQPVILASLVHPVAPEPSSAPPPSEPAPPESSLSEPAVTEQPPVLAVDRSVPVPAAAVAPPVRIETQSEAPAARPRIAETPAPETPERTTSPSAPAEPTPETEPASASERASSALSGGERDAIRSYLQDLMRQLKRHKTYPAALKKAKTAGTVVLQFSIDRNGRLVASGVKRSSGHPALDRAALDMLAKASPLPPIPAFVDRRELSLSIPVEYSLITDR